MNHPTINEALAELDDTRTKLVDFLGNQQQLTNDQRAGLSIAVNYINRAVIAMPHVQVPNA